MTDISNQPSADNTAEKIKVNKRSADQHPDSGNRKTHLPEITVSKTAPLKCSVKKFVDFTCRTGDLESIGTAGPTAAEGQKAHKVLQAKKSPDEEAEVKVECTVESNARQLKLSGRVDLLNSNPADLCVSEIKSCYAPPHRIPLSAVTLHWAQLKVYGYCVLKDLRSANSNINSEDVCQIKLRLIWYNIIADEVTVDEQQFDFDTLESYVTGAATRYIEWIDLVNRQFADTLDSAAKLEFPHKNFRAGQRDMAATVYLGARDGFHVMCEAPTGIGKTVSALFPAVKAIGNGSIEQIIYLTAKNSGKQAAADCITQLADDGLKISAITITSKKTTCHCSNGTCERNAEDGSCPLTIGFYDRLPNARLELISSGIITPAAIDEAAHKHRLCPFELIQQMLPWVQVIVGDFNYVFDPLVRLSSLIENTNKQLLLVDEAHNLTDRARSMYSASLDKRELKRAVSDLNKNTLQAKNLQTLIRAIDRWSKECTEAETAHTEKPKTISRAIKRCMQTMMDDSDNRMVITESTAEAGKSIFRYAVIEELFGEHHRCITQKQKNGKYQNTVVNLQCLNATDQLQKTYKQFRTSVSFSATLRPQQFYFSSLGLPQDTRTLSLDSPFNPTQQCTLLCDWIDTRYNARTKAVQPIVDIIMSVYGSKRGNYQVFFPSYAFMESVFTAFTETHPEIQTIIQKRGSSEDERQQFLNHFSSDNSVLAFSIMGGVFGEAVDYTGDQLIGSIIVGTGLSSINLTQQLIEADYKTQGWNGFDYASRYPGFTRVLQTAGRVIRSETDRGVVVLVDQRFNQRFYTDLFPTHWDTTTCNDNATLANSLNRFWQSPGVASAHAIEPVKQR